MASVTRGKMQNIKTGIMALASTDASNPILTAILELARKIPDQQQQQQQQQPVSVSMELAVPVVLENNNNNNNNSIVAKIGNNKKVIKQRYGGTVRQVRKYVNDIINLLKRMSVDNVEMFGFSEFEKILNVLDAVSQEIASEKAAKEEKEGGGDVNEKKRTRKVFETGNVVEVNREDVNNETPVIKIPDAAPVPNLAFKPQNHPGSNKRRGGGVSNLGLIRIPNIYDDNNNDDDDSTVAVTNNVPKVDEMRATTAKKTIPGFSFSLDPSVSDGEEKDRKVTNGESDQQQQGRFEMAVKRPYFSGKNMSSFVSRNVAPMFDDSSNLSHASMLYEQQSVQPNKRTVSFDDSSYDEEVREMYESEAELESGRV